MRTNRVIRVIGAMGHRYGHEVFVVGVPMAFDFHIIMFLGTMGLLIGLFIFEMAKDGLLD